MRDFIYSLFGKPIPESKGVRGTSSGKLVMDKKVFYKRNDVQDTFKRIKNSQM